jgi:hypothetical protein
MADNSSNFVCGESRIGGDRKIVKPKFGLLVSGSHMYVRWFVPLI